MGDSRPEKDGIMAVVKDIQLLKSSNVAVKTRILRNGSWEFLHNVVKKSYDANNSKLVNSVLRLILSLPLPSAIDMLQDVKVPFISTLYHIIAQKEVKNLSSEDCMRRESQNTAALCSQLLNLWKQSLNHGDGKGSLDSEDAQRGLKLLDKKIIISFPGRQNVKLQPSEGLVWWRITSEDGQTKWARLKPEFWKIFMVVENEEVSKESGAEFNDDSTTVILENHSHKKNLSCTSSNISVKQKKSKSQNELTPTPIKPRSPPAPLSKKIERQYRQRIKEEKARRHARKQEKPQSNVTNKTLDHFGHGKVNKGKDKHVLTKWCGLFGDGMKGCSSTASATIHNTVRKPDHHAKRSQPSAKMPPENEIIVDFMSPPTEDISKVQSNEIVTAAVNETKETDPGYRLRIVEVHTPFDNKASEKESADMAGAPSTFSHHRKDKSTANGKLPETNSFVRPYTLAYLSKEHVKIPKIQVNPKSGAVSESRLVEIYVPKSRKRTCEEFRTLALLPRPSKIPISTRNARSATCTTDVPPPNCAKKAKLNTEKKCSTENNNVPSLPNKTMETRVESNKVVNTLRTDARVYQGSKLNAVSNKSIPESAIVSSPSSGTSHILERQSHLLPEQILIFPPLPTEEPSSFRPPLPQLSPEEELQFQQFNLWQSPTDTFYMGYSSPNCFPPYYPYLHPSSPYYGSSTTTLSTPSPSSPSSPSYLCSALQSSDFHLQQTKSLQVSSSNQPSNSMVLYEAPVSSRQTLSFNRDAHSIQMRWSTAYQYETGDYFRTCINRDPFHGQHS